MQIVQVNLLDTEFLVRALELAAHELRIASDTVISHDEAELCRDEDISVPSLLEPLPDDFFAVALKRNVDIRWVKLDIENSERT